MGWKPNIVGVLCLAPDEDSSEGHALRTGEPVISPDIRDEKRFRVPAFLLDNRVAALVNVLIPGSKDRRTFGVLQVDSRQPRRFDDADIAFLRTYANLLAAAVERLRAATSRESVTSSGPPVRTS